MSQEPVKKEGTLLPKARELRRGMTPQEKHLWYDFLQHYPVKIYKQRIIGTYIVDFYCASAKLAIELDGMQHETEKGRADDAQRTAYIMACGIEVLRFPNWQVDRCFDEVTSVIAAKIRQRQIQLMEE